MHPTKLSLAEALRAARETRALEIGDGILSQTPALFQQQFAQSPAIIIADKNTFAAAGRTVAEAFRSSDRPMLEPFVFEDPDLYAEHRFVAALESVLRSNQAIPIAVGSGTLNDLTKLAAHRTGRAYMCVATAASMDGYTAFGASITYQGSKQTFMCPAPKAVLADLSVIGAAPPGMNASGYADLVAKVTAGADWIVADSLGVEAIDSSAWTSVQGRLRDMIADPAGVEGGSREAIGRLIEGLMLGGFAMQTAKSSRPASGAEHQFSHLWDMQHHTHRGQAPSHGFKVGIGTLAVTALYERLFAQPLEQLDVDRCVASWPGEEVFCDRIRRLFGDTDLTVVALQETRAKHASPKQLREQLERLRSVWPELRERLRTQLLPLHQVQRMLQTAGAPVNPEQIGISRQRLRESFWPAYFIRRRFTVLDLAVRAGVLDVCLEQIFGPEGLWPLDSAQGRNPGKT
ncbi:MAG TPA: sn-glycerol-1-phosphate dehydrogenase [Candidatus Sulfotelmatobacter sp.]|nr:sn-glycerol-1-phosphate dehydrogenase [Candidatus Sulfotelmatobacter sp.]